MLYTISIFSKRIVNFLLNIILARIMSVQYFGEYTSYIILASYILLITEFGYSEYTLIKGKQNNNFPFLFTNFTIISIITFIVITAISMFFEFSYILLLLFFKVYLEVFLNKLLLAYYQYTHSFRTFSLINIVYGLFVLFLCIYIYYFSLDILYVFSIINLFLIISLLLLFKRSSFDIKLLNISMLIKSLQKGFSYFGFSSVTVSIYMQMPLIIMIYMLSKEEVGIFYAAYMIASVMILLSFSINQQYLPKIIGQTNDFYHVISKPLKLLFIVNVGMLIVFYFWGEWILYTLFQKEEFIETNQYLLLLIVSNLFQSISGLLAMYLVGNDLLKKKLLFHIEFIVVALLASLPLIYFIKLYGVAASYVFLYLYVLYRYYCFIKKYNSSLEVVDEKK